MSRRKKLGAIKRSAKMQRNASRIGQRLRRITIHASVHREIRRDRGGNQYMSCVSVAKAPNRSSRRTQCSLGKTPSHALASALRYFADAVEG